MPAPVTIGDIARVAGVHPATVSRALHGAGNKVSAETQERVARLAREMGYRPNIMAASLRTKRTNLIAIIVPDIANPLFGPLVQGLEVRLRGHGFLCLVIQTPEAPEQREELILALADRKVSGLLILAAEDEDPMLDAACRLGLATVLVNRGDRDRRYTSVLNDDEQSVRLILEHLAGLGHRRVAHVAGPQVLSTGRARRQAFVALCSAFSLLGSVVEAAAFTRQAGYVAGRELLARGERPSAIFAANDLIAMGVLDALREAGLSVPGDVSLVGHNDMPLVDVVDPPLTTVRIATEQMVRQSADLLLEHMADPDLDTCMRILHPRLIVRKSTGSWRKEP